MTVPVMLIFSVIFSSYINVYQITMDILTFKKERLVSYSRSTTEPFSASVCKPISTADTLT